MGIKTVQISLTSAEKALLLQVVSKDKTLQKVLRFSQFRDNLHVFVLTEDEAVSIGDLVLATMKKSRNEGEFLELKFLLQLIADAVMENVETQSISESNLPPEMQKAVKKVLKQMPLASVEEINDALAKEQEKYNNTGQADFQGLSPVQVNKLLSCNIDDPGAAIQLNKNIPLKDFAGVPFLNNSRILLQAAVEGLPVTALGNLNRKSTKMLMDTFTISDDERERTLQFNKILNEEDVRIVHMVRVICELAGLVRKTKGAFRITKLGQGLLVEDKAGELFAKLFLAYFTKFNLSYLDRCPELPDIQDCIDYSLYVASKMDNWTNLESAAEIVFLPTVLEEIRSHAYKNEAQILTKTRLIWPLEAFGLMECEIGKTSPYNWKDVKRVRKTTLFDQFLRFNIGVPQKHTNPNRFSKPRLN